MLKITISRGTFSGGQIIAESVAEKLGYRCIARVMLVEAARQHDVPEKKLSQALTKKPGVLESWISEMARYLACIRAALVGEVK